MSAASEASSALEQIVLDGLTGLCGDGLRAADRLVLCVRGAVASQVVANGRVDRRLLESHQALGHGFAWMVTYVEALRQLLRWAEALAGEGRFGELEALILQAGYGEYLSQLLGGIAMSQGEIVRPAELGASDGEIAAFAGDRAVRALMRSGNTEAARARIAELVSDSLGTGNFGDTGLDETYGMIRDQFRRFADEVVTPYAHESP